MMKDIYEISSELGLKTYLWGGFAVDILTGKLTREHGDLDCFSENLVSNITDLKAAYEKRGYKVNYLEDFWMLQINKGDENATFNNLRIINDIVHWYHIGKHGTVFSPELWLDSIPNEFYGVQVYTAGVQFLYAVKTRVELLSPEWKTRKKDEADIKILKYILDSMGISEVKIYSKIWNHNPYWYAKGYEKYLKPIIVG